MWSNFSEVEVEFEFLFSYDFTSFFAFPNFYPRGCTLGMIFFFVFIKTLNLLWKPSNWLKIYIAYLPALLLPITNIKWFLFIKKYEFNNSEFLNLYIFNEKKAYLRDLAVSVYFGYLNSYFSHLQGNNSKRKFRIQSY